MLFGLCALLLAVIVLGLASRAGQPADPALAMAMAAGAFCLGGDPATLPDGHAHDHCLICQGAAAVPPVAMVALPARAGGGLGATWSAATWEVTGGGAAYAPPASSA